MNEPKFEQKMNAVLKQADALRVQVDSGSEDCNLLPETLDALMTTIEELHVAQEELIQSNAELEAARNAMEEEKYRYQELFEAAPDGYLVTNLQGVILRANLAVANLLGYGTESLAGKPVSVFVHNDERSVFRMRLNHFDQMDRISDWELTFISRDDEAIPVAVSIAVIHAVDGQHTGLRWIVRDNTEWIENRRALQKARDHLEKYGQERVEELMVLVQANAGREARMIKLKQALKALHEQIEKAGMIPVVSEPWLDRPEH